MNHLDLFSGIGGFALAARLAGGYNTVGYCDNEPAARVLLTARMADGLLDRAPIQNDVRALDYDSIGAVDVLTGGFPCQPFSLSGRRLGVDDSRYLWPAMLRVIKTTKPKWVIAENVAGIRSINNYIEPAVLEQNRLNRTDEADDYFGITSRVEHKMLAHICDELIDAGYRVICFFIPACAVDALHQRNRCWIIACRDDVVGAGEDDAGARFAAARASTTISGQKWAEMLGTSPLHRVARMLLTSQKWANPHVDLVWKTEALIRTQVTVTEIRYIYNRKLCQTETITKKHKRPAVRSAHLAMSLVVKQKNIGETSKLWQAPQMWASPTSSSANGVGRRNANRPSDLNLQTMVGLFPTPQGRDGDEHGGSAKRYLDPARNNDLTDFVKLWPTPRNSPAMCGTPESLNKQIVKGAYQARLEQTVQLFPTPTRFARGTFGRGKPYISNSGSVRRKNVDGTSSNMGLAATVAMWPTPGASEARVGYNKRRPEKKGPQKSLTTIVVDNAGGRAAVTGSLNADWVEWLMGYPIGWTRLAGRPVSLDLSLDDDGFVRWPNEPDHIPRVTIDQKNRGVRLKCLGNAVVPQVPLEIFHAINCVAGAYLGAKL